MNQNASAGVRTIDLLQNNLSLIRMLARSGLISYTVIRDYEVYVLYSTMENIDSEMQKYSLIAGAMNYSESTVRKAIANMKKEI